MASSAATLSLCSSFTTHCRLSPSSSQPSLSLSKPFCALKSSFGSLSSTRPAFLPVPKFAQTDAPVLDAETDAPVVEVEAEAPVVEAETDAPAPEATEIVDIPKEVPKREEIFAVVMVGSRQYIVFPGRYITTQRLKGANVNDKIVLNKVLLVGTRTETYIGKPVVTNAAVHAVVEEQYLDKKVIVFKYKKKKNYRRNIGHRQPVTRIRITEITGYQDYPAVTLEQ